MRLLPGILSGLLLLSACGSATDPQPLTQSFPAFYTARVAMRDGLSLATDVYLPRRFIAGVDRPMPAILVRTPYNKNVAEPAGYKSWALANGIAMVSQDTRGRFASDGTDAVFQDDGFGARQDGYDTVEWIAAQPWSDGRICTLGPSALGITQTMMAAAAPPHLVCQFILVAPSDLYEHAAFQGGVSRDELLQKWLEFQGSLLWYDLILQHPEYDNYWTFVDALARSADVTVPAVHVGGWFDIFSEGTLATFRGRQHEGGAGARGRQKLVMGPGDHVQTALFLRHIGPDANPVVGGVDLEALGRRWFAHYLLGEANGVTGETAVRYFLMDGSQERGLWRAAADWPPPATTWTLPLGAGGALGQMGAAVTAAFTHDPANPLPTLGGRNLFNKSGAMDQRSLAARPDRLLFVSEPLAAPADVVGEVKATLTAALDGDDGYFVVQLLDIAPGGEHSLVTEGSLRAQHRDGRTQAVAVTPGAEVSYELSVYSTAWRFNPGHRIALAVAGSNAPRLAVYPERRTVTLRLGGSSELRLPIVR